MKALTKEGQIMFKLLDELEEAEKPKVTLIKPLEKDRRTLAEKQVEFFRLEIESLINNSKNVVADCESIIQRCGTKYEYLSCDAKIAKTLHLRNIERYNKLLNYQSALS